MYATASTSNYIFFGPFHIDEVRSVRDKVETQDRYGSEDGVRFLVGTAATFMFFFR